MPELNHTLIYQSIKVTHTGGREELGNCILAGARLQRGTPPHSGMPLFHCLWPHPGWVAQLVCLQLPPRRQEHPSQSSHQELRRLPPPHTAYNPLPSIARPGLPRTAPLNMTTNSNPKAPAQGLSRGPPSLSVPTLCRCPWGLHRGRTRQ